MQRISVIGISGAGKTTVSRHLARRLELPLLELDAVYHQENWAPLPIDRYRARVAEFVEGDRWVIDGNYTTHGISDLVWPAADTIVWLDPSRPLVMRRVVLRTIKRILLREQLWNGNRESLRNVFKSRPEDNIILWAWTRYDEVAARYTALFEGGAWAHLDVFRLRTPRDVKAFFERL